MTITPHARAVLLAAADWLEANPDKHITGALALSGDTFPLRVSPTSTNANCFCAVGRIIKEAGIGPSVDDGYALSFESHPYYAALRDWFEENNVTPAGHFRGSVCDIYTTNDRSSSDGRPDAIRLIREIAAGIPVLL